MMNLTLFPGTSNRRATTSSSNVRMPSTRLALWWWPAPLWIAPGCHTSPTCPVPETIWRRDFRWARSSSASPSIRMRFARDARAMADMVVGRQARSGTKIRLSSIFHPPPVASQTLRPHVVNKNQCRHVSSVLSSLHEICIICLDTVFLKERGKSLYFKRLSTMPMSCELWWRLHQNW